MSPCHGLGFAQKTRAPPLVATPIQGRPPDLSFQESKVEDAVLSRVLRFASSVDCPYVWIDRECINQDNLDEKQHAIQSMDLVYSRCRNALALLSITISAERDLIMLQQLLAGEFVQHGDSSQDFRIQARGGGDAKGR